MEQKAINEQPVRRIAWLGSAVDGRLKDVLSRNFDVETAAPDVVAARRPDTELDALVTACANDEELRAHLLGPHGWLSRVRPGCLLVETSYISEPLSREIDTDAHRASVGYLRAPTTLGPNRGGRQIHTAMVSGPRTVQEHAWPVIETIADKIVLLGEGDEARAMTRVLDVMTGVSMAMWAEALVFGEAVGLNWHTMLEVMQTSAIGSPVIQLHTARVAARDFSSALACEHMAGRLAAALDFGKAMGVVLSLTGSAQQMYLGALRHGLAKQGLTAIIAWLETAAGTRLDAARAAARAPSAVTRNAGR